MPLGLQMDEPGPSQPGVPDVYWATSEGHPRAELHGSQRVWGKVGGVLGDGTARGALSSQPRARCEKG